MSRGGKGLSGEGYVEGTRFSTDPTYPKLSGKTKTMVHKVVGTAHDHSSGPAYCSTVGPAYNSNLVNEL